MWTKIDTVCSAAASNVVLAGVVSSCLHVLDRKLLQLKRGHALDFLLREILEMTLYFCCHSS